MKHYISLLFAILVLASCNDDKSNGGQSKKLQLASGRVGLYELNLSPSTTNEGAPFDQPLVFTFGAPLDTALVSACLSLSENGNAVALKISYLDENKTFSARSGSNLKANTAYSFSISDKLKGKMNETFPGVTVAFTTQKDELKISSFLLDHVDVTNLGRPLEISLNPSIEINFTAALNPSAVNNSNIILTGSTHPTLQFSLSESNKKLTITSDAELKDLSKYSLKITADLSGANGEDFSLYNKIFYTKINTVPDYPVITDDELLTLIQKQTFKYFYDYAEPTSGMARERNGSGTTVTSGGSGFGIMSIIVGIERNFITRTEGIQRLDKILTFLEGADRFHGAWSHWINGSTGKVIPFGTKDNGGDLVETSFLMQGLLTFRQYLNSNDATENALINRINVLWKGIEWDWYRKDNQNVLYWHWSPNYNWDMNFPLYGYFEEQITYILAAASPTHSIPKEVYSNGYGNNGSIKTGNTHYGYTLPLGDPAPLFWVQYSYLGMNPHFSDDYANYWQQNVNATLIDYSYCVANPKNYVGYSENCWGLTASDIDNGYGAQSPANDIGVITPTAALSSFPYTPEQSMKALKFFYYTVGDRLWGDYGFYDAFNITSGWTADSYLAIDQGPIIVMIENYRTGLLWNLFMSAPEIQDAKTKLGLTN